MKLKLEADWLDLGEHEELCRSSDDALDAVVAAMTAWAAACGLVEPIPEEYRAVAAVEGWIALPTADLGELGRASDR